MKVYSVLAPSGPKAFRRLRNFALGIAIFPIICVVLWLVGVVPFSVALIPNCLFLYIIVNLLWRYFYYKKIVFSKICFQNEKIEVLDHKGNIWRSFQYAEIKKIKVIEINGMFHGFNGISTRAKYIVFFFNRCEELPENSFKAKFRSDDYFPILYREEIWNLLRDKMRKILSEKVDNSKAEIRASFDELN